MAFIIYRHPEGISLNGREYLLDDKDKLITFDTYDQAKQFLIDQSYATGDIDENVFIADENEQ